MTHASAPRRAAFERPLALVLAGGLAFQAGAIAYLFAHFDAAILRLMPDDAFYYLKIAQNISAGLGSVFSPGEPTNGYHPLWMGVLVVGHWLFKPGPEAFILGALLAAIGFNLMAAGLLRGWLGALGLTPRRALAGAFGYLFAPWLVALTLTGLETPLYFACLFGFLWLAQHQLSAPALTGRAGVALGAAAGVLMLARTDAVFFVGYAFARLAGRHRWAGAQALGAAGGVAAALVAPWLAWNYAVFGSIGQSSSLAISALYHYYAPPVLSTAYWAAVWRNLETAAYWLLISPLAPHTRYEVKFAAWPAAFAVLMVVLAAWLAYRATRRPGPGLPDLLWAPAAALALFYVAVRLFVQVWHLAPVLVAGLLLVVEAAPRLRSRWALAVVGLGVGVLGAYSLGQGYFRPQEWDGRVAYFRSYWPEGLPGPLTVCITDSGIPAYFSPHTVVNLDGVVNNRALTAILAGQFSAYVKTKGCDRVIMDPGRLAYYDRNLPPGAADYNPRP